MNKKRLSPRLICIAITICLSLACSVFSSEPKSTPTQFPPVLLYPVFKSGKAGYINSSGTLTIPIEYDDAINFSEGLAAIQQGEIWGYINASGELVIPPSFDQAYSFHDGLAKVKVKDRFGYIDHTGKLVIEPVYEEASHFSESLATVLKCTSQKQCTLVEVFGDASFNFLMGGERRLINLDGKTEKILDYEKVGLFYERLAVVKEGELYGFIDNTGSLVIPTQYDSALGFSDGLAAVEIGEQWGFIDTTGALIIPAQYDIVGEFSEGLASVIIGDEYGFIDKTGAIVIKPQYDGAGSFSEGLAAVKIGELWGFIDKTGLMIIQPQFNSVGYFLDGIASVRKYDSQNQELMGYINKQGEYIWQPSK